MSNCISFPYSEERHQRTLLAQSARFTAEWRENKACEFPDDAERNLRCAEALRRLAHQIEQISLIEPKLRHYCEAIQDDVYLEDVIASTDIELRTYGFHRVENRDALQFLGRVLER